ncbi:MAG: HAD-IA family hydrolase, partial [Chitinophagaceae bacterium]|nr:HAD-IA family hydrolase [Chitinophagaceae bacterium]
VSKDDLKLKHKILSEVIHFPDRTDRNFYEGFNSELLISLGIIPSPSLLDQIFSSCTYLPWQAFEDTAVLSELSLPVGVISNFNSSLREKLRGFFGPVFSHILISEEEGVAKPDIKFYNTAMDACGFDPGEILYIGDSVKLDIIPAEKAGMKALLIDRDHFYPGSPFAIRTLKELLNYIK